MNDLIKALQIFAKYKSLTYPTHSEHERLYIVGINKSDVSGEDLDELSELSFKWDETEEMFYSYRFGSC